MKQPCASVARLRGSGPILTSASKPRSYSGCHHLGSSSASFGASACGVLKLYLCWSSLSADHAATERMRDAVWDFAGGDQSPHRDERAA